MERRIYWNLLDKLGRSVLIVCLLVIGSIVGCERVQDSSKIIHTPEPETFKVGMLLPGSISDQGWNALAHDGLTAIGTELGAEIDYVESLTPADWESDFRTYAMDGYHLIFGHGYEYQEAAIAIAHDYPEIVFITSAGASGAVRENVAPIVFRLEQATYLLGMIAGLMTQTDKIGMVGGQELPSGNSVFMAFEGGVKSVNPNAVLQRDYVGDWENIAKARDIATTQIQEGVDFIFHNANEAGLGAFEAVVLAQDAGKTVYAFGANRDQSAVSPRAVLANAVITPKAYVQLATAVKAGTFESKLYVFTMTTDGAIALTYNPELKSQVPQEVQQKVKAARQQILAGTLEVPQIDFSAGE
ncbi:BMP family ABC transporter substrate-binding protein [Candidatus Poribacteria bacterium]|nr:BMP family ABC transporter substrate-binding protein [Candidatus Poribacteria bacterium]MYB00727.1 BMP family ABC transporter substrate-binding protein [Candidatus Poribacteria bacterium]